MQLNQPALSRYAHMRTAMTANVFVQTLKPGKTKSTFIPFDPESDFRVPGTGNCSIVSVPLWDAREYLHVDFSTTFMSKRTQLDDAIFAVSHAYA